MAFHKADLVRTLNRNPVFFSICSIWGAYFVTWVWLLKFYVCVHFQSILTHFLPECGRLGIQSTYLWSGASLEAWEGFTPLHSFSSVESYREASGDGMGIRTRWRSPQWGQRKGWWMHKETCGFIGTSKARTIGLHCMCSAGHTNTLLNFYKFQVLI